MKKSRLNPIGARKRRDMAEEKALREKCLERANGTCQRCPSTYRLERAHLLSRGAHPSLSLHPENDMCLCHECHVYLTARPVEHDAFVESIYPGRLAMLRDLEKEHYGRVA